MREREIAKSKRERGRSEREQGRTDRERGVTERDGVVCVCAREREAGVREREI